MVMPITCSICAKIPQAGNISIVVFYRLKPLIFILRRYSPGGRVERNAVALNGKRIVIGFSLFPKLLFHFIKGFLIFLGFFCNILIQRSILRTGKHRFKFSDKIRERAVLYFVFHNFPMVVFMLVLYPFLIDGGNTIN